MKKTPSILMYALFILTILYPAGTIITGLFGYSFELISISAFSITLVTLSLCILIIEIVCDVTIEDKILQILLGLIAPLSLVNILFVIFQTPPFWVIPVTFLSVIYCFYLTCVYGKPFALKVIAMILSMLLMLPAGTLGFMATFMTAIEFGQNTVVYTLDSPNGEYYAEVIDSDQGALGGDTLVNVHHKGEVNFILFKIKKKSQLVYLGQWGEYEHMRIRWKDDHCLVINSREYEID